MKFIFSKSALIYSVALLLLIHFNVKAQIELPVVIGNNMVLQQGQKVPVWGKATPGYKLKVTFAGQNKYTRVAADSSWRVDLDPLEHSFKPSEMIITSDKTLVKISNILVGEVWLCAGQSNMAYMMDRADYAALRRGIDSSALELKTVNDNIKLFKVDDVLFGKPQKLSTG